MKITKIFALSGTMAILLLFFGFQGIAAQESTVPSWMPSNVNLAGYSMIWSNNITVQPLNSNSSDNVTCYTQVWLKEGNATTGENASIIGASMLDSGGNYLALKVNLYDNSTLGQALKSAIARGLLTAAGFSEDEIKDIHTIWDIFYGILKKGESTHDYTLTEPVVPGADFAAQMYFPTMPYFNYALMTVKGDHVMLAFDFDAEQEWLDYLHDLNDTAPGVAAAAAAWLIGRFQFAVWGVWISIAVAVAIIVGVADALDVIKTSSFAPGASSSQGSGISTFESVDPTVLQQFASEWASLFDNPRIPGYEVVIVSVASAIATGLVTWKLRRKVRA